MKQVFFFTFLTVTFLFCCKPTTTSSEKKESIDDNGTKAVEPITSCYLLKFGKDINAFQVTVNPDNSAEGFIAWEPFEKDGGRGFFEGKKENNLLTGDFTYMIEGSIQTEEVVFKIVDEGVAKERGTLDDSGERFIIVDKSSLSFEDIYKKVDCSEIMPSVENAKAVTDIIRSERSKRYETLTGTYDYDLGNDQGAGELLVKQLDNNQVKISFNIVMHGPAFNQGFGEGIITLNENLEGDYIIDEFGEECKIRFSFKGKKVISEQLSGNFMDCGFGNNVYANQVFMKSKSADPFENQTDK